MSSIFTKIVHGEIPSYKIAEDENYYAFLDIFPLAKGHTLVIPKKEVDYLFDLDDETLKGLTAFSKRVAKAIDKAIECKRVGVVVLGLEVPHAHIHLIPLQSEADACFSKPKLKLEQKEFEEIAERIISEFK
jgi:histidine triad (HIT) family protein